MKIGYVSERDSGVDYHRLIRPFEHLAEQGHEVTRFNAIPLANVDAVAADVVVFNRFLAGDEEGQVIPALQARGVKVICDVDDYWVLPSSHILYRQHKKIGPRIARSIEQADEVWVTHEALAQRCRPLNPNVSIVPNAIALQDEQWQQTPLPEVRTIGYIAGATHLPDMALTVGAWRGWTGNRLLCGLTDSNRQEFTAMAAMMSDHGKLPFQVGTAMDVWNYGKFYDHISIAVAPLADTAFNRCKSNLKILESGAKARPIFVQAMHPYFPFRSDGVIHVTDWKRAISQAEAMSADEIAQRGAALRAYIEREWSMDVVNVNRLELLLAHG